MSCIRAERPVGRSARLAAGTWAYQSDSGTLRVANPAKPDYPGIAALAAGMAVTLALAQMRLRFWWWPLHPVGYLAANVWGAQWWWSPLFVGWLLKSLTVRYGGLRLYQRMVPAAIGVIVADSTCVMLAPVVESLAKSRR